MTDFLSLFVGTALADTPAASAAPAAAPYDTMQPQIFMFILIFAVFYFFLIRPQQKRLDALKEIIKGLKKGDKIITGGGIHGTVINLDSEQVVTVEIADGVRVKVDRSTIAGTAESKTAAKDEAKKG